MAKIINRTGESKTMNCGWEATIIEYNNAFDLTVQFTPFKDTYKCTYRQFNTRQIKSKLFPSICNVGFIGIGKYSVSENSIHTNEYVCWFDMMRRCYNERQKCKNPTYIGCNVCDEWHNFQNFAKWYNDNYYEVDQEMMCLDKDILVKGNKVYSPDTCVFVPEKINKLFTKCTASRGEYSIGVSWHKQHEKFSSTCNDGYRKIHLGYFYTEIEAFKHYKKFKEKIIKEIANTYKDKIPKILYDALYKYEVEITD